MVISRERDTRTCCRAFGRGAVTSSYNFLGLSRPGIEPRSRGFQIQWALSPSGRGGLEIFLGIVGFFF